MQAFEDPLLRIVLHLVFELLTASLDLRIWKSLHSLAKTKTIAEKCFLAQIES